MALQGLYRRVRRLVSRVFTDQERQLLAKEVDRLKSQLQSALEHIVSQNSHAADISRKLQSEVKENKTLWDQVEYLTTELNKERIFREKHVCHREKADFKEAAKASKNPNKPLEETRKQQDEPEQGIENYFKLEMVAQRSELRQPCKNLKQIHEETDQRHSSEIAEEKHRNTLLQQKLQEAECIIGEQNVILDRIKQEIKLLQQRHHEEAANVVHQPAKILEAREEGEQCQALPLKPAVKDLPGESACAWRWNAPRTCWGGAHLDKGGKSKPLN